MAKAAILLILIALDFSYGYPLQRQLEYLKRLVRRDTQYHVWNVDQFPNPQTDLSACNRRHPSTICNPDKVLSMEEADKLEVMISRITNETSCVCSKEHCTNVNPGISVGVAVMKNMFHNYQTTLSNSSDEMSLIAEEFAKALLTQWNFGKCGDSIIIVLATDNQQSFIVTGDSVKKIIDSDSLDSIFEAVKGHFTTKAYYQGLESLIQSIFDKIRSLSRSPVQNEEEEHKTGSVGLTIGLVVGFLALAVLFAAGVIYVRKRQQATGDKFASDSHKASGKRDSSQKSNIVKVPQVFPDAVYQPCSIEDPAGNFRRGSDEEINLEEKQMKQSVNSKTPLRDPDGHNARIRQELSRVDEEDSKDILEDIDVDDPEERIVFAQTHQFKPPRKSDLA